MTPNLGALAAPAVTLWPTSQAVPRPPVYALPPASIQGEFGDSTTANVLFTSCPRLVVHVPYHPNCLARALRPNGVEVGRTTINLGRSGGTIPLAGLTQDDIKALTLVVDNSD
jgi:hypothetical protein